MVDILHHNIKSHGDIQLNSRAGDIRLNTKAGQKVFINSLDVEAEIQELKDYIAELKLFISSFKNAVYLENDSGQELNYTNLL
jgi:hypothetical protein